MCVCFISEKAEKNTHSKRTRDFVSVGLRVQAYGYFLEAVQVDRVQTELFKNGMLFMCFRHFRITATHMTKFMLKVGICVWGCMRDCAPCTLKVWFLFQKGLRETGTEREACSHISTSPQQRRMPSLFISTETLKPNGLLLRKKHFINAKCYFKFTYTVPSLIFLSFDHYLAQKVLWIWPDVQYQHPQNDSFKYPVQQTQSVSQFNKVIETETLKSTK